MISVSSNGKFRWFTSAVFSKMRPFFALLLSVNQSPARFWEKLLRPRAGFARADRCDQRGDFAKFRLGY